MLGIYPAILGMFQTVALEQSQLRYCNVDVDAAYVSFAKPKQVFRNSCSQVSFLGIRNRGNRNNGFYSWDYVDLGLNSAPATKNSGLRPLGLNSEIKTFNGPLVHFFFLLGLTRRPEN